MKINLPQRPNPNEATDPAFLARHTETVVSALKKGLSFDDNFSGALMKNVALAHGVPTLVANPLPQLQTPVGAIAMQCDSQAVPQVTVSKTALLNGVLTTAPKDKLFLTALYPLAEQFMQLANLGTGQPIASGVATPVQFAATPAKTIGTSLTYNGSTTITVGNPGLYDVRYTFGYSSASGADTDVKIYKNGGGIAYAFNVLTTAAAGGWYVSGSAIIPCSAKDTLTLNTFQSSGSVINTATSGFTPYMEARQLSNDASLTANNTIFIVGG